MAYSRYETYAGNAVDPPALTTITPTFAAKEIRFRIWDQPVLVYLQYNPAAGYGDTIELDPTNPNMAFPEPIFFQCTGVQIQNKTALLTARYEVDFFA